MLTTNIATATGVAVGTESLVIGMGEYIVTDDANAVLACIGLGSCIAVCVYDRLSRIGGMVHVVLPRHDGVTNGDQAKYANTAVPMLLQEVLKTGGIRNRLMIKIAGGARMTTARGLNDTFKTGERNLAEVIAALEKEKLSLAAADTGGSTGRTVKMYLGTGKVTVKMVGCEPKEI